MKKKIILILVAIIIVISVVPLWNIFKRLLTTEGQEEFKNMIVNMGIFGPLIILGLTISQIFIFFLPGEPIEILAGMCYGSIDGLFLIYLGTYISSLIIFFLVRKIGKSSIYNFISKDKIEKIENSKFFNEKNIEITLLFLFIIPGTPKDLLTYIGALLPIDATKFIIFSTLLRFPSIITSTIIGNTLAVGNITFAIIVSVVTIILSGVMLYFCNKKQNVKEIMNV